jgi:hypothetical protein
MEPAMDIAGEVLTDIVELGVPWWGWTALVAMIFWGLLGPGGEDGEERRETLPGLDLVP